MYPSLEEEGNEEDNKMMTRRTKERLTINRRRRKL
jgi:hypothetical protein